MMDALKVMAERREQARQFVGDTGIVWEGNMTINGLREVRGRSDMRDIYIYHDGTVLAYVNDELVTQEAASPAPTMI
jgi:hypothetical protein